MENQIDGIYETEDKGFSGGNSFTEKTVRMAKTTARQLANPSEGVKAGESHEGEITKRIESITSQIPSATFLSLAVAAVGLSAGLRLFGFREDAQFVGHWVPTILTLGLYNKLVKLEGSE